MRIAKSPRNDPQRERVYAMERTFMDAYMTYVRNDIKGLTFIAKKACDRWGVSVPHIRKGRKSKLAAQYDPDEVEIVLYARGLNPAVLLHELAHHIDDCLFDGDESHGPVFVAIEADLLNKFRVCPVAAFRLLAKQYGVKIANVNRGNAKRRVS